MRQQLEAIRQGVETELKLVSSLEQLENIRIKYLGKKGELTGVLRGMGALAAEERPIIGQVANEVRAFIEQRLSDVSKALSSKERDLRLIKETIDVTMPGKRKNLGGRHPLSLVIDEVKEIFMGMGYEIAEGPEIEFVYNNFDKLNIPVDHPSRDEQDTFYIETPISQKAPLSLEGRGGEGLGGEKTADDILLRTQTSPVQIRVMETTSPPIKIICPGRVYRSDAVDATHSPIFNQIEGLVVDRGVTMGDLIGTLQIFARNLFGENTKIRLRPHHFPFTEPSAEIDVTCWNCKGKGCRICKNEGWIEILGAGMVHPKVLSVCGIDPEEYSGFAFGLGIERTAMGRFNIDDLRHLYENDVRFLKQF